MHHPERAGCKDSNVVSKYGPAFEGRIAHIRGSRGETNLNDALKINNDLAMDQSTGKNTCWGGDCIFARILLSKFAFEFIKNSGS